MLIIKISKAFSILHRNFLNIKLENQIQKLTFRELAKCLVNNSNPIYNFIYLIYSICLIFTNYLPRRISKKLLSNIFSPQINPVTKVLLFYIYHNAY